MREQLQKYYIGLVIIAAICVGAIIWYYAISRGAASDQQKVSDITTLQSAVDEYSERNSNLPDSLDQLELDKKVQDRLKDYDYTHNSDSFTICANFKTDASIEDYYDTDSDPYYHGKGRQCFTSDVYLYDSYQDDPYTTPDYDFDSLYNQDSQFDSLYQ